MQSKKSTTKEILSKEVTINIDEKLGDFLKGNVNSKDAPDVEHEKSIEEITAIMKKEDHGALNHVLLNSLSPALVKNESQKRVFKQSLLEFITNVLKIQLGLVGIVIVLCYVGIFIKIPFFKDLSSDNINTIFDFLKFYISATIVELIAMLFFIVKYVFDKSIVDLMKEHIKK